MDISHKLEYVEGDFDTVTGELVAVQNPKYGSVTLCFRANMNITFAEVKLHSRDLAMDADAVLDSAYALAEEITRRFNEFPQELKK